MSPVGVMPVDNLDLAWERPETVATLRVKLAAPGSPEWLQTAARLMREARVEQVWQFLTLQQVADHFPRLSPCWAVAVPSGSTSFAPPMNWEDSNACTP
ncbi:MAG: hypothetical protein EBS05_11120 [Proteobacteria bacterium]|nr:hypothetical protein [Pseudomonadota bacterium]